MSHSLTVSQNVSGMGQCVMAACQYATGLSHCVMGLSHRVMGLSQCVISLSQCVMGASQCVMGVSQSSTNMPTYWASNPHPTPAPTYL
jgi:hypothetical protein